MRSSNKSQSFIWKDTFSVKVFINTYVAFYVICLKWTLQMLGIREHAYSNKLLIMHLGDPKPGKCIRIIEYNLIDIWKVNQPEKNKDFSDFSSLRAVCFF